MKILFLSAWFPLAPDNGSKIRVYNMLRSLSSRHEVTLLSFIRPGDVNSTPARQEICKTCQTVPWRPFRPARAKAVLGYLSPTPRSLVDTFSTQMARLVSEASAGLHVDVVIASTIEMARYALSVPARAHVLEEHNFTTRLMRERYKRQTNPIARLASWLTYAKYLRYEADLFARFDAVTMVSEVDAAAVRSSLPKKPLVKVIPNGVDLCEYPSDDIMAHRSGVIFTGSLTYAANLNAVRYFLTEIWPLVKQELPAEHLKITGRHDGVDVREFSACAGVELTGYVDNIRSVLRQSAISVIPIREGGGTRLKILEAMALGTPVVSTSKGAEGLEVTSGQDIWIADDPREFAELICRTLKHPDLGARMAKSAADLVRAKYDWKFIGNEFEALLQATVSRRA